ncbi:MAG: murein hydrolase activator EnvC family protein [Bacteriovoracaceae bacterium]
MGRIIFLFILLSLFSLADAFSAPYSLGPRVKKTMGKVDVRKSKVQLLEKQMVQLDQMLTAKNSEIESYSEKLTSAHEKIDTLKSEAKPMQEELSKLELELKKLVKQYVVTKLDDEENPANLYAQKMMIQVISLDLEKLRIKKMENESSDKQIKEAEENLLSMLKTKETLQSLMAEMKGKKEALAFDLEEAKLAPVRVVVATPVPTATANAYKSPVKTIVTAKTVSKNSNSEDLFKIVPETISDDKEIHSQFSSPINNFIEVANSAKGVTFTFSEVAQVVAPGAGEVVFAGELSTYGNVVMIDHGGEIRTVLLGNFQPKVRKHDKLNAGELIGYTEIDSNKKNTLYFEVRKKNVAQNTVRYLNKNLLKSRL